jgi:hypothetical protein
LHCGFIFKQFIKLFLQKSISRRKRKNNQAPTQPTLEISQNLQVVLEDHEFLVVPSVLVVLAFLVLHPYQGFPYYLAFLQVLFLLLHLFLLAAMD